MRSISATTRWPSPGEPFPIAVALGADPATILGAVTPVPDTLSEYQFAGLLRGGKTEMVKCLRHDLQVPASAEIVLEGFIRPDADDPTGTKPRSKGRSATIPAITTRPERFPVFTIERMTLRRDPIYHSTYTGKPPDEPAMLGVALNEVFVPLLQKQYPEIADFYLPPEGCSYRLAVVSMKKQYAGHAKRVMFGIWSFLRQFMYTKMHHRHRRRREHPRLEGRDLGADHAGRPGARHADRAQYADRLSRFRQSRSSGLGSKMGIDATNKWPGETTREWGRADRHGCGGRGAGRRDLENARALT